ncbi:MAG: B12-binding domain-containing radical SAM protein [Desulfobacterales bacterium]|nr:B12-binding domain-containing radical SAM protein [Desulfobacterales bacterium]
MKVLLMSMPDVTPIVIHEMAVHMPNHGIASIGGNIDVEHEVYIIDLIRKRNKIVQYLTKQLMKIRPDIVGLSAMTWQYDTCVKLIKFIKHLLPNIKVVIGGYHATLMYEEISQSPEAEWIDFIIRGEGEESCRRLVNALAGTDQFSEIPSLSYKKGNQFIHNDHGPALDLSKLKLPIRDHRRLTWGYHVMNFKIEVMETSRGCTRSCSYCSIQHMYGRSFRVFPIERVLADLDDIYYKKHTRWVFFVDDNIVLNPKRVIELCDAIIHRKYRNLNLVVQADCISMAKNEEMVKKMAQAGFKSVFLGIENASRKNLEIVKKAEISNTAKQALENCHKYGIMVMTGLIFGFPDDDESNIKQNYELIKLIDSDTAYCQILTPYPKTELRKQLMEQGLITNMDDYKRYNGLFANVKTQYLSTEQLQYQFWYHRQHVLGWWDPPERVRKQGVLWTSIWIYAFRPLLKLIYNQRVKNIGWEGRFQKDMQRISEMNYFKDLEKYSSRCRVD